MPAAAAKTQHSGAQGGHEAAGTYSVAAAPGEQTRAGILEIQQWRRNDALQARLWLGSGDDPGEREADRTATWIVRGAVGARPLSPAQRRYDESRFGRDACRAPVVRRNGPRPSGGENPPAASGPNQVGVTTRRGSRV